MSTTIDISQPNIIVEVKKSIANLSDIQAPINVDVSTDSRLVEIGSENVLLEVIKPSVSLNIETQSLGIEVFNESKIVEIKNESTIVQIGGARGERGADGASYLRRHAYNDSKDYCGFAIYGSKENENVWTITRITVETDGTTIKAYAYNVNWTDYLTHIYA